MNRRTVLAATALGLVLSTASGDPTGPAIFNHGATIGGPVVWQTGGSFSLPSGQPFNQFDTSYFTTSGNLFTLLPSAIAGLAPVQSVAGRNGNIVLAAADITDFNSAWATLFAAQLGTGAGQAYPGNNPSGFITASQAPVQSVGGHTGRVTDGSALTVQSVTFPTATPVSTAFDDLNGTAAGASVTATTALSIAGNAVQRTGDTMQGRFFLNNDPVGNNGLEAATYEWVEALVGTVPIGSIGSAAAPTGRGYLYEDTSSNVLYVSGFAGGGTYQYNPVCTEFGTMTTGDVIIAGSSAGRCGDGGVGLFAANNLGDLTNVATARSHLGLTAAATDNVSGTGSALASLSGALTALHGICVESDGATLGDCGAAPFTSTSAGDSLTVLSRALAAWAEDRINVKAYGAIGNYQSSSTFTESISPGSSTLTVSGTGVAFGSANVGQHIEIPGAGPFRALGYVASIPVAVPGAYTVPPVIGLGGLGSAAGVVPQPYMAAQSASLVSGGTGCPASQTITLTISGGVVGTVAAQVTGNTNSSGVLTGALTVITPGGYQPGTATTSLLAASSDATTGPSCTTYPTVLPVWGLGSVFMAGVGANVPLTGVTASVTGSGSLGTPVIAQVATPLSAHILSASTSGSVSTLVLDTNASQTLAGAANIISWGADDTAAFATAKTIADTREAFGVSSQIYIPAGKYLIDAAIATFFQNPTGFVGDGADRSVLRIGADESGPLITCSECWTGGGAWPATGNTAAASQSMMGPVYRDFSIYGDMTVAQVQGGIRAADRVDRMDVEGVSCGYVYGSFIQTGVLLNKTQSYLRESTFKNIYANRCGAPGVPVYDFDDVDPATGGDSTNTNYIDDLEALGIGGPGLVIRSQIPASGKANAYWNINGVRVECNQASVSAALIVFGDPTFTGSVSGIDMSNVTVPNNCPGSDTVLFTAPSLASQPYAISLTNLFVSGSGRGIDVQAGRKLTLDVTSLGVTDTSYIQASSSMVGYPIKLNGNGQENNWSTNIDATTQSDILHYAYVAGWGNQGAFGVTAHDGSAAGGNPLPQGAVDMQTGHTANTQIPGATFSTIGGGHGNQINSSGSNATIPGGAFITLNGQDSFGAGSECGDKGRTGLFCYANGDLANQADSQLTFGPMSGSKAGAGALRLTADANAAGSTNAYNISDGTTFGFSYRIVCTDVTTEATTANVVTAYWQNMLLSRTTGASTAGLKVASATAPDSVQGNGTGLTALSFSLTADTANGGFNPTVTITGSDTWHCNSVVGGPAAEVH